MTFKSLSSTADFIYQRYNRFIVFVGALVFTVSILNTNVTFAQCSIDSIVSTDISCNGLCDGTIEIFASGGSGTYMYSTDNGTTFQACNLFTDLCSSFYNIVVDDLTGCQAASTALLTEPSFLLAFITDSINAFCNGFCDGSLQVTPIGGVFPYTYFWNTSPIQTAEIATGLCAGVYDVAIQDANGCWTQAFGTVSEPSPIIDSTSNIDATSCGSTDGTATVYTSGGTPPYTYLWNDPASQTTSVAAGLSTGAYIVAVTDSFGCTENVTVTISDGEVLSTSSTSALCNGSCDGAATVSFSCSSPPCNILWFDESWVSIGQTDTTATGLCAGVYHVSVDNNSGCMSYDQVIINEPALLNGTASGTNTSCPGSCDGSATVATSGGTSPYTYSWSPSGQTTQTATGLCAGIHTLIVTDSIGCSSDTFMVTISSPDTLLFNTLKIDATCGACDGQGITCITGGTPPYSYSWITGSTTFSEDSMCPGTYGITVTDANSCVESDIVTITELSTISIDSLGYTDVADCFGDTTGTITIIASGGTPPLEYSIDSGGTYQGFGNFTGLGAGSYNITVRDSNLCTLFDSILIINEPLFLFISTTDTICANDSIFLEGSYQNTPGTYYDTLLSVNSCDSVVATTLTVNSLPIITVVPSPGIVCNFGDTVILVASGAVSYAWSPATGLDTTTGDTVLAFPPTDTAYTVVGTSIFGCIDSTTVSVQIGTLAPVPSFTSNTSVCEGNSVIFNNTSTNAIGYSWSFPGGTTVDTTLQNPTVTYDSAGVFDVTLTAIGCSIDSTITLTGYMIVSPIYTTSLSDTICTGDSLLLEGTYQTTSGTYYDTLTTGNGCDSIISTILIVNPIYGISDPPVAICNGDSVSVYGIFRSVAGTYYDSLNTSDGCDSAHSTILDVNSTYSINDPAIAICNGDSISIYGLFRSIAGTYYDSLLTINGCDSISATTLTVNPLPTVDLGADTMICNGCSLTLDAGAGFTSYNWSTGASGQSIVVDSAGSYSVQVTDANGCTSGDTIVVNVVSGTNQSTISNHLSLIIYPNPTTGQITLANLPQEAARISVYNILGELVDVRPPHNSQIDITNLTAGIYLLQLQSGETFFRKKIIKL